MSNLFQNINVDFSNPAYILWLIFALTFIIFFRYLIFSLAYHFTFFKVLKQKFSKRFLHNKKLKKKQYRKEIYWSAISGLIFGGVSVLLNFFNILDDTVKIGGAGTATNPNTRDLVQIENASLG